MSSPPQRGSTLTVLDATLSASDGEDDAQGATGGAWGRMVSQDPSVSPSLELCGADALLIGRSGRCQGRIRDARVSATHARIAVDDQGRAMLTDLR